MKTRKVELISASGQPIGNYVIQDSSDLRNMFGGYFLQVTYDGLFDYSSKENPICESGRFIYTEDLEQKNLLQSVQTIKCYLRESNMEAKIVHLNPYLSVNWLYQKIESQVSSKVQLYLDGHLLVPSSTSLISHIYDDAIIHILPVEEQETLSKIYFKEPQTNSVRYEITNVKINSLVQDLKQSISKIGGISLNNLYLVYGGRVMNSREKISQYGLNNNCFIYSVDGSKYLKKLSREEYQRKIEKHRFQKDNVKILRNSNQRIDSLAQTQSFKKVSNKKAQQVDQDDFGYSEMKLQTTQMEKFRNIDEQQLIKNRAYVQDNSDRMFVKHDRKVMTLADGTQQIIETDIVEDQQGKVRQVDTDYITTKRDSNGNVITTQKQVIETKERTTQIITRHIQNKQGEIVSEQIESSDVYTDKQGNIHTYEKSAIEEKGGKLLQVQHEIVTNQKNQVIENENIIIEKKISENGRTYEHQEDIIEKDGKVTKIESNLVQERDGTISHAQVKTEQIEQDQQGNIHIVQAEVITDGDSKVMTERQTYQNQDGCIIGKQQYKQIQITQDKQGHIHEHQHQVIRVGDDRVQIDKDKEYDEEGNLIQEKVTTKQINETPTEIITTQREQITQIEQIQQQSQGLNKNNLQEHFDQQVNQDGKNIKIHTDIKYNEKGEIIEKDVNRVELQDDTEKNIHRYHEEHTHQQIGITISKIKDIEQDLNTGKIKTTYIEDEGVQQEDNIIHCHERKIIQEDGKQIIIDVDQYQDQNGDLIMRETDQRQITTEADGTIKAHIIDTVERKGIKTIQISDEIDSPNGTVIRKERDEIQIIEDQSGNIHKHEIDVVEENNKLSYEEVDIQYDQNGVIIKKVTDDVQVDSDNSGHLYTHERKLIQQGNQTHIIESDVVENADGVIKSEIDEIDVKQREDGTVEVHERDIVRGRDGKVTERIQDRIQNANGENIIVDVDQKDTVIDEDGNIHKHQRVTVQLSEGNQLIIDKDILENSDGDLIRQQKNTVQITNTQNQVIIKQTNEVVEVEDVQQQNLKSGTHDIQVTESQVDGNIVRTQVQTFRDQSGQVIEQHRDQVKIIKDSQGHVHRYEIELNTEPNNFHCEQKDEEYDENGNLVRETIQEVDIEKDDEGNTEEKHTNIVIVGESVETHIGDRIQDKDGNVLKNQTDDINVVTDPDGTVHRHETDIIQQDGHIIQRTENTIENKDGQKLFVDLIEKDQQGNTHHHRTVHVQRSDQSEMIIDRDTITNATGQIIRDQKDIIENIDNGEEMIVKHKTQTIEIEDYKESQILQEGYEHNIEITEQNVGGKITKTEIETYRNQKGEIVQRQRDEVQISQDEQGHIHRIETDVIERADGILYSQKEDEYDQNGNLIKECVEQIDQRKDGSGNIYEQKLNEIQENGAHLTHIEKTITDSQGNIIRKQNDDFVSKPEGNEREIDFVQQNGKVTILETNHQHLKSGATIDNVNNIEITKEDDGKIHTHYAETTTFNNKQICQVEDTTEDQYGNIIQKQTKHIEIVNNEEGITQKSETIVRQSQGRKSITQHSQIFNQVGEVIEDQTNKVQLVKSNLINQDLLGQDYVSKEREVFEDQEGNIYTQSREVKQKEGLLIATEKQYITNAQGKKIREQTAIEENLLDLEDNIHHREINVVEEDNKVSIQASQNIQDIEGNILCGQSYYKQIKQDNLGCIEEKEVNIMTKNDRVSVNLFDQVQDSDGNLIYEKISKQSIQKQRDGTFSVTQSIKITDNQGNIQYQEKNVNANELNDLLGLDEENQGVLGVEEKNVIQNNLASIYNKATNEEEQKPFQQRYDIFVHTINGKKWTMEINFDDNIDDISSKFCEIAGCDKESLQFYFQGQLLEPYQMAEELGLLEKCTLYVQIQQ